MATISVTVNGDERQEANEWVRFGMKLAVQSVLHPIEYAKTLIQIGFEPIDAKPTTSLFGKPVLAYPNVFQYIGHIKRTDGLIGCYRGLTPKIVGNLVSSHFSEKIADYFQCPRVEDEENDLSEEEYYKRYETKLKRDVITHTAGAIISSPFHVISIRMMAQFVGKETKYNTIVGSIVQIYNEEGILGFFSGLIPRLIFDLSCVVIASTATYLIGRHFIKDKEARVYISPLTSFVCSSMFYPMNVVSTCMIINGAGLVAGSYRRYDSWQHCYHSLKLSGDHKRGSSLFFRYIRQNPIAIKRMN